MYLSQLFSAFRFHIYKKIITSFLVLVSLPDAFSLDPNTGLVRSRRLLQSSERFNLTVVATDQGRPPLWGTADLIITVIDVNDNRPVFVRPTNGTIIHISEVPAPLDIQSIEKEADNLPCTQPFSINEASSSAVVAVVV